MMHKSHGMCTQMLCHKLCTETLWRSCTNIMTCTHKRYGVHPITFLSKSSKVVWNQDTAHMISLAHIHSACTHIHPVRPLEQYYIQGQGNLLLQLQRHHHDFHCHEGRMFPILQEDGTQLPPKLIMLHAIIAAQKGI